MRTVVILLLAWAACAVEANAQPGKQGFWVIEGNPKSQNFTTVRYYTGDRRLIGEEVIRKKWVDISRRRNVRKLNQKLYARLTADSLSQQAITKKKD